jgi:hypothetical protein
VKGERRKEKGERRKGKGYPIKDLFLMRSKPARFLKLGRFNNFGFYDRLIPKQIGFIKSIVFIRLFKNGKIFVY